MDSPPPPLARALREYWERNTAAAPSTPDSGWADRLLLEALGLAAEEVATLHAIPLFADFQARILEAAGAPDPLRLERYLAWIEGAPAPEAVRLRLREIEELPPALGPAELARWDEQGYAVLGSAITRAQAKAAEQALWHEIGADPDEPDSWYGPREHGIMIQLFRHPALDPARHSPRVHKAFTQLWGTADLWTTTDRLSFNPPERGRYRFPGPPLHWDVSLASPIPFGTQGLIYLTDTEAGQGAFRVVPGFHRRIEAWRDGLDGADPRRVDLSAEAVPIAAGAGDLIIWRRELPHGAGPNRAARPRMVQYVNMYPAGLAENPVWI